MTETPADSGREEEGLPSEAGTPEPEPAETVSSEPVVSDPESTAAAREKKARLEAAKRRYRATLRNEADTGDGGFSKDFYRSQKPPHWG